jgi:hypothetical protein
VSPHRWRFICICIAALLSLPIPSANAQAEPKTLVRWNFAQSAQGWFAAHAVAPLAVRDGALRVSVISEDPYVICGDGPCFDIQASDRQAVVIRAKVKHSGGAEFFWASTVAGKDLGFAAGKEIAFNMIADGRFHTYRVFPLWRDRVTRLRFDPPGDKGQEVWIDYVAIEEYPAAATLPREPVWDFRHGLQGFLPQSDIDSFALRGGRLELTALGGQQPALLSPPLEGDAKVLRYLTIRVALTGVEQIVVCFAAEDAKFGPRQITVPAIADGKLHTYLVETTEGVGEAKTIARLRINCTTGKKPAAIALQSVALASQPSGPPEVTLDVTPQNATAFTGMPRRFRFATQNVGGQALGPVRVTATSPAFGRTQLVVDGPQSLAPGEKWIGSAEIAPVVAGQAPMQVRVSAPPAPPVTLETRLVVSRGVDLMALPHHHAARAVNASNAIWISNDRVGLALAHNRQGYGPALLCVWRGLWKPVATIPALGELTAADKGAAPLRIWPKRANLRIGRDAAIVELRDAVAVGQARGAVKVIIRVATTAPDIEVELTFAPSRAGRLLRFAGPALLAGDPDPAFDGEQEQALLPGLEWLVTGEHSSSTLDIAPPGNIRFAPDPNRITVPLMAVAAPGGGVVGIGWDMMQPWDGANRPNAVFASPNFLEHQDNHLMQLFVPTIPRWTDENHLAADRPYELRPGQPLVLRQRIFALPPLEGGAASPDLIQGPQDGVRDAVRWWYARYGAPPLPNLPRSYDADIALSIRGYEDVLYVKGKGWMPVKGWVPDNSPRVALYYILAAQALGKRAPYPDLERRALDRVGAHRDLSLAAHVGGIAQPLFDLRSNAYAIASSQDDKGGWYFQPDPEHRPLGEPGKTTVGTVAANVATLLRAARMFHDPRLLAAGVKGLAFMEQFRIPRGAQVWEVPLHTPDILAAGYAVDACLAGYLATGDEAHRRRAVYWAEAGLPFLYTWQAPDKGLEAMRYGCIPVFGATWYTGSWFGRIVQWCGLAYATSLLRLAEYDKSLDWRRLAEGVTRSGIIQQRTEKEYLGLYPDSIGMLDGSVSWGAMLSPGLILDNVFPLIGRNLDPNIETPTLDGEPLTILAAGELSTIQAAGDEVSFSLSYPAGQFMYATLVGVSAPTEVRAAGTPIAQVAEFGASPGYRYDSTLGVLEIKLRRTPGETPVIVRGVKVFRGEGPRGAWDFASGSQGWQAMHSLAPVKIEGAVLVTTIAGDDPFMGVTGLEASTADYGGVRIRLRATHGGGAQLFFAAGGHGASAASCADFMVLGDGEFHDCLIDLRRHPLWRGTVTALRIDPPGQVGDRIEIASVVLIPRSEM